MKDAGLMYLVRINYVSCTMTHLSFKLANICIYTHAHKDIH